MFAYVYAVIFEKKNWFIRYAPLCHTYVVDKPKAFESKVEKQNKLLKVNFYFDHMTLPEQIKQKIKLLNITMILEIELTRDLHWG